MVGDFLKSDRQIRASNPELRLHARRWQVAVVSAFVTLVAMVAIELHRPKARPAPVSTAVRVSAITPMQATTRPDPDSAMRVYRQSIVPLLDEYDHENARAVSRAVLALHERMEIRRVGVGPFARDLRSWGTRLGLLRRYPSDLLHKMRGDGRSNNQVGTYVNEKFRGHVMSEQTLEQDLNAVLKGFEEDLAANRNRLYSQISLPLADIHAQQPLTGIGFEQFQREVEGRSAQMNRQLAPDTLVAGIAEFSASWVATDVAQSITSRLVAQILARAGASLAVEGISAGGATVGGTAAGGGAGSFAGPAGTIIGIGVGLVVGAAVDWWLSDQFEAKVIQQTNHFLDHLEARLRDGDSKTPGLRKTLTDAAKVADQSQRQAIEKTMREIKVQ